MPDYSQARLNMVDCQVRPADVTDLTIISAMLSVPRERFVPPSSQSVAYIDEDISLDISTHDCPRYLMEPASLAKLLQLANIQPDAVVLDVGCATGYSTAILSRLCSSVVALEQDKILYAKASENLAELEVDNAVVLKCDLEKGYPKESPYDAIFVGGAVDYIPDNLLEQLKNGGNLVCVVGTGNTGRATLYVRENGIASKSTHFNCAIWPIPGFRKQVEFVL